MQIELNKNIDRNALDFLWVAVLLFVCVFFMDSCTSRVNKIYGYKETKCKVDKVHLGAKLIGAYSSKKDKTIYGSPYELFVWVEMESEKNGVVSLSDIKLQKTGNNTATIWTHEELRREIGSNKDGKNVAYFSFQNLDLAYVPYMLTFKLRIEREKPFLKEEITLFFDTDYKEFKSNDFWDKIKSV